MTAREPRSVGGVPTNVQNAADDLVAAGDDVEILTGTHACVRDNIDSPQTGWVVQRFPVWTIPGTSRRIPGISTLVYAVHVLRGARHNRPDVVFCAMGWPFIITGFPGNQNEYNLSLYSYDKAFGFPPSYGLGGAPRRASRPRLCTEPDRASRSGRTHGHAT